MSECLRWPVAPWIQAFWDLWARLELLTHLPRVNRWFVPFRLQDNNLIHIHEGMELWGDTHSKSIKDCNVTMADRRFLVEALWVEPLSLSLGAHHCTRLNLFPGLIISQTESPTHPLLLWNDPSVLVLCFHVLFSVLYPRTEVSISPLFVQLQG